VMGPSGAGKTTLISVLLGRATYGVTTGDVFVNGEPDSLQAHRSMIGFVPQDDIMLRELTVWENLLFGARYRLPASTSNRHVLLFVEYALDTLGLQDIRDQAIGDETTRGISGGQRKRVNVGLELVIDPALLLLDEPTSGLDSTSSRLVVKALRDVARSNVTVGVILHQPSYQIFQSFDMLLFLGKGGRTVYYGPEEEVVQYFEGLGFELPPRVNPADWCMDLIGGLVPRQAPGRDSGVKTDSEYLFERWKAHQRLHYADTLASPAAAAAAGGDVGGGFSAPSPTPMLSGSPSPPMRSGSGHNLSEISGDDDSRGGGEGATTSTIAATLETGLRIVSYARILITDTFSEFHQQVFMRSQTQRNTPGFLKQALWIAGRCALQTSRRPFTTAAEYLIFVTTGVALGIVTNQGRMEIMHSVQPTTYCIVALGLLACVSGLSVYGSDKLIFYREASSGLHRVAYFVAKDIYSYGGILLKPWCFIASYWAFATPGAELIPYYAVTCCIVFAVTGISHCLSITMEPAAAQLSAAVLALINALIATRPNAGGLLYVLYQCSYARWGLEAYVIAEGQHLAGVWIFARCATLKALGYDVNNFKWCLFVLVCLGIFWRVVALVALFVVHRNRQR